jgi:hypothetical protein
LVLRSYNAIEEVIDHLNQGPRPLALYSFGADAQEQAWVLDHTLSGGVSINDVTMHPALHDAPFGGVGASGMGHYHGREGFMEFSHARSIYSAGAHDPRREWGMLPPYNAGAVTQTITVNNSQYGQKPLVMRLKINYTHGGQPVAEEVTFNNFPPGA